MATTMQNGATAIGLGATLDVSAAQIALVDISGNFNATIVIEGQSDGSHWRPIAAVATGSRSFTDTITGPGSYTINVAGFTLVRANITAYVSGSITAIGSIGPLGGSGGGAADVQYTEGDTDATITGTAMLWEDGGDTLRAVSAAKPLPTSLASAPNITTTMQPAASAAGNGTAIDVSGMTAARFEVTGTFTGITANWEGSADGGTTYSALNVIGSGGARASTTTATGRYAVNTSGLTHIRARLTTTSPTGTITIVGHAVAGGDIAGSLLYNMTQAMQGAAAATGNGAAFATTGFAGLSIQVTGTFVGTLTFEATVDGTNWVAIPFTNAATGVQSTTATAPGIYAAKVGAFAQVRARISAYTSGTITATGYGIVDGGSGQQPVTMMGKSMVAGDTALLLTTSGAAIANINAAGASTSDGLTNAPQVPLRNDGTASIYSPSLVYLENGQGWDRQRSNLEATPLTSGARTVTNNSASQANYNSRGARVSIDVTAGTGFSIVPKIQTQDPASGVWVDVLTGAAITAIGHTELRIYPGIAEVANQKVNDILARTWRVRVEHADATPVTYSAAANVLL